MDNIEKQSSEYNISLCDEIKTVLLDRNVQRLVIGTKEELPADATHRDKKYKEQGRKAFSSIKISLMVMYGKGLRKKVKILRKSCIND